MSKLQEKLLKTLLILQISELISNATVSELCNILTHINKKTDTLAACIKRNITPDSKDIRQLLNLNVYGVSQLNIKKDKTVLHTRHNRIPLV